MFKEDHLSFRQRKYMKVKNIIGRALGGIGLVVLSPVYLAIIVAIKKEDGITAPVFFSQKRVGIHKEYFNLYKFRSMRTDTPHDKPTHLLENPDQYITKVGRFLRKSSLDELPQLWNIARGDMAVIGPRPALWNQDDLIAERDKYGANDVKPGLTGWAQINGRDELEIPVKARLDPEMAAKARVEVLQREMGEEVFAQYRKIQLDEAENTPEGEAVPGQMACRAGKSSFVVNWQGEMRSCVVLDKPSIPLRDVEFEEAWKFTKKETESLRISARCSSCKLRKVCNTCVAAAIAETGKADGVPEYLCRYTEATVRYLKETSKK